MIRKRLGSKGHFIVPGFYGRTAGHLTATLGPGSSDLTGAYIAGALEAKVYENYTDQEGVLAANPDMFDKNDKPHKIKEITFKELRDLAYSGFKVFHQSAMHPVAKKGVPVHIRSTEKYPMTGTIVKEDRKAGPDKPIVGVAYRNEFCAFNIEKEGLNEIVGIGRDILSVFADRGISYELTPMGIDDFSVVIGQKQLKGENSIDTVTKELTSRLGEDSSVKFQDNLGILVVAGKGLKGRKKISAEVETVLADAGVNFIFKDQGATQRCMIWGIDNKDGRTAVHAVYDRFLR
jgi:aspartate kinase